MKKIIPELTRDGYKKFFKNFDDSWEFEKDYPISKDELPFAKFIIDRYSDAPIFAVRRVESPKGVKMPDYIVAGYKTEQKLLKSEDAIKKRLKHAYEQGAKGVFIEKSPSSTLSDEKFAEIVRFHAKKRGMLGYLIAKKNTTENIGGVSDGRTVAFSVIDESVSNLIVPQNIEKINSLGATVKLATKGDNLGVKIKKNDTAGLYAQIDDAFYNFIIANNDKKVNITALRQKSAKYWQKRSLARTQSAEKISEAYIQELKREYEASANRAAAQIKKFYLKTGADPQKIKEITPNGQLSKFLKEVRSLGLELPENYQWRVNREEFLQAQLWLELQKLGVFERTRGSEVFEKVIRNAHEATMRDYGVSFSTMNDSAVRRMLDAKFAGENFKTRIDERSGKTFEQIKNRLAMGLAKGEGVDKMVRSIRDAFGGSEWKAERLVRTEVNHFENASEIEAYRELGIEWFEFMAYLDGRTSEICRELDGKKIRVRDAVYGENVPPCHPNCRSTIVAVFEGEKNHSKPEISAETPNQTTDSGIITKHTPNHAEAAPPMDYFGRMDFSLREFNSTVRNDGIVDYSKLPHNHPDYLHPHEQKLYERLVRRYGDVLRIPKDKDEPTNDFIVRGVEWEAKSPKNFKYKNIAAHIKNAVEQGKENFIIDMGDRLVTDKMVKQMGLYNSRNPEKQAKRLVIWGKGDPIEIVGKIG